MRERGHTHIDDQVVSIIARIAAEKVDGVHSIGESSLRNMFRGQRHRGVDSNVGLKEAAVDIEIITEFGYPIRDIAQDLREAIITSVESMTGRDVVEVNVFVIDVHLSQIEGRPRRQLQ